QAQDPGAGLEAGDVLVLDLVVTRGQLPQAGLAHLGRTEHAVAGLVDLAAAVEHHAALHVEGLDVLVRAERLAEGGIGVFGLEEHRAEQAGQLQAVGIDLLAAGAAAAGDRQARAATAGVVGAGREVGRTLVDVLVADPAA